MGLRCCAVVSPVEDWSVRWEGPAYTLALSSFICLADAADEPNSDGYWMKLSQWNHYRNDTFKDRRDDELPFIPAQAPAAEGGVAVKVPQTPSIKTVFTLTSEGVHTQSNGNQHSVICYNRQENTHSECT